MLYKYYLLINKEGYVYFGSYYNETEIKEKDDFAIKLKEEDFYEYWEKNKKEIYNNLVKDLNNYCKSFRLIGSYSKF